MKKLLLFFLSGLTMFLLVACGNNSADDVAEDGKSKKNSEAVEAKKTAAAGPIEPTKEHLCTFCNMEIYTKDETMGSFTAQAIDSKGNNVFFDDSGCLLNHERHTGELLQKKWVRNYLTQKWIDVDDSMPVHAEIKTPMKYGYAFFETKDNAEKFVSENSDIHASISTWEEIDNVSHERYKKKMEMKMNKEGNDNQKHEQEDEDEDKSESSH